ncbi:hypothetical protein AKJ57_01210 [candidate division MSBL1 archaeon SCGC-AAA259A05]|uniref:TIGR04076 family protein n=1 Tax=candidate division MSBL1 archaeon SCGC-AAA259A05 TaxID=1698259 RepID=A0A133UB51_9EURY|nr:hypothetical protein AKJ57_01210 [candidate division MSBL1 archaeon SCGC-AAA259A05]
MPEKNNVRILITVEKIEGTCPIYDEGDEIEIENFYIVSSDSENICVHALSAMTTFLTAFLNGVSAVDLGLGTKDDTAYIQCPDPGPPCTEGGTVLFKLKRLESGEE